MSIPTSQRALILPQKHGKFIVETYPVEKPGTGELLVRIESVSLNPIDWIVQALGVLITDYPAILGLDSAGVVAAVGEGVTSFAVGDKVLNQGSLAPRQGTFKQYTYVTADSAAKIPANLNFDQAATVPLCLATAAVGLYAQPGGGGGAGLIPAWETEGRGKYAGQTIVIFGGATSVGQFVIQLAKLSGFSTIVTTVSPHNNTLVKSLGATHMFDRRLSSQEIFNEIRKIASDSVKIAYAIAGDPLIQDLAYDLVASGGTVVSVLPSQIPQEKLTPDKKFVTVNGNFRTPEKRALGVSLYSRLPELLASGELKPTSVEVLPGGLYAIAEGLERMKKGEISGKKLVFIPRRLLRFL
ncbi:unnamed protein product [Somion occarium]|uniref:Enoyl reductase (ER) domain-containing protein n=1 Tax=Somion occarium TaxID=3059160 RepID=A0ABP1EEA9_9APHY